MLLHTTCWLVGSVKRGGIGKLMDQMESIGINPKLITYNTLIYGFCNVGKFDKASCLFDQLKSIDQSPTLVTYIVLFSGLYMFKIRVLRYKRLKESETLVLTQGLALNLFSYDELKKICWVRVLLEQYTKGLYTKVKNLLQ